MPDLRYTVRSLLKSPGFAAIAILTLALCIGANSAIFSVVNAILLKPYPWPDAGRLVYIHNTYPSIGVTNAGCSIPDYLDRRAGVPSIEESALYTGVSLNLSASGQVEHITGQSVTPSLFSLLKTAPALGRAFTDAEAQPGAAKTVVLSDDLWRNRFGANPAILGTDIRLDGEPCTVIGVMPPGFYFPDPRVRLWVPFVFIAQQKSDAGRHREFSTMVARLKPGATIAQVQRDVDAVHRRLREHRPDEMNIWKVTGFGGAVTGFLEENVHGVRAMLWLVQAGVFAALLIGCANVASLLLARAVTRERELAIRAALGAGRARLVRLLLAESLLLFLVGGALGLLVAGWGVDLLGALGLSALPRGFSVQLDFTVFSFTLLCALAAGVFFGAMPAWSVSRSDAGAALKEAGARGSAGRRTQRLRAALVVGEIALAVMLLSTAGLLVKSFARLQEENPGFHPGGVLTAHLSLSRTQYDRPEKILAFVDATFARLRALPGVRAAGLINALPFSGKISEGSYSSPDLVVPPGAPPPHGRMRVVDPGYFKALGLTLLRGRFSPPPIQPRPSTWWSWTACWPTVTGPARIPLANASPVAPRRVPIPKPR
jgi:predicted permease